MQAYAMVTRGRVARRRGAWLLPAMLVAAGCAASGAEQRSDGAPDPTTVLAERDEAARAAVEERVEPPDRRVALVGAEVLTADAQGHRYDPGYVVFDDGRIQAVGAWEGGAPKGDEVSALEDARVVEAEGMVITPGIVDTHSHLGVYPSPEAEAHDDGNEATDRTTPGAWASHAFWPQDPGIQRAVAGGVTTIQVLPGSANLIGGRTVTLHMVPHRGARAMRFPGAPGGVKMACGENPKRVYGGRGQLPSTRMGNALGLRQAFVEADRYLDELEEADSRDDLPDRDVGTETLASLLDGRLLAHVHCYRADDMLKMMRLAREFGFEIRSFHHGLEAYKIRDVLAEAGVSVSTWSDWWGFKLEAYDAVPANAAMVHAAGGRAVIHSDDNRDIQRLNQEAAKALRSGKRAGLDVDRHDALRWITANAAWTLGIADEVGTIEPGKRADLVVWDGDPFSVYTKARWVFVDGGLRWDAKRTEVPWSDFELGQEVAP